SIDPACSLHSDPVPTVGLSKELMTILVLSSSERVGYGAGRRGHLVPGRELPARPWAAWLRDLARGGAAGGSAGAGAGKPAGGGPRLGPERRQGGAAAWSGLAPIEPPAAIAHLSRPAIPVASPSRGSSIGAAGLLGAGVACGIAGLFPVYLSGASLASDPANLVPHAIYLATWLASGLLIVAGGTWRRVGALLGLGTSVVTFGYLFADLGTVISGGSPLGSGRAFALIGWLLCTTGAALAAWPPGLAGALRWQLARRGRPAVTLAVTALLAAGAAAAFAPSWDRYTLRTSSQLIQTVTAGNIFSNPGPVIAGNVAVI